MDLAFIVLVYMTATVIDKLQRPMRDLRISVTDRCNFRCRYCMPAEVFGPGYNFLPREQILRFSEVERLARHFVSLGVRKLRLTGGEPLLRRDIVTLVRMLSQIDGVEDLAMTTNGTLLKRFSGELAEAGLQRVTVSLDALDNGVFSQMNGVGASSSKVIEGVEAALEAGLGVKLNTVVQRGVNESELVPLARFSQEKRIAIRYIEFMDTGMTNGWKLDQVVSSSELLQRLKSEFDLSPVPESVMGETAQRYHIDGIDGFEVGFISSVTKPFCSDCNRIRLSADGHLYTCLFANHGYDIKSALRSGESEREIEQRLKALWGQRHDRYSEQRSHFDGTTTKKEMSYLGG